MTTVTTKDGVQIFYKDWGPKSAQPIVFHHGWPLSSDDWDTQMLYFASKGYRVIAHDRRGHGRSTQVSDGHDMDHYAADVAAVVERLDLRNSVHVGHSTGGGEATRYVARHGKGRVAKLVLISAVPPLMLRTAANPGGLPIEVFDGLRKELAANRQQFYLEFAGGPFYGYNRPGAKPSQAVIWNWWRQGMMGGAKAQYDVPLFFARLKVGQQLFREVRPIGAIVSLDRHFPAVNFKHKVALFVIVEPKAEQRIWDNCIPREKPIKANTRFDANLFLALPAGGVL
jgi:non-heme chloroperoxidase